MTGAGGVSGAEPRGGRRRFIVIGAGIVGAAAAYRLAAAGDEVMVADVPSPVGASGAAAGVVSPGSVFAYGGTPPAGFTPLAVVASQAYGELRAELSADGFEECGYSEPGALVAATDEEERRRLDDVQAFVAARRALGTANIGEPRLLSGEQARRLHPLIGPATLAALHLPEVARVDGRVLTATLRAAARRRRATFLSGRLVLASDAGRVRARDDAGTWHDADAFLVAAGCWSDEVLAEVAPGLPVGAESGELLHCRVGGATTPVPVIMGFVHTRYLLPVGGDTFVLGATQGPRRTDSQLRLGGIAGILAEALRVSPALADATFVRGTVGNRPTSPDRLPMLGPCGDSGQVFVATGHGSYGLMQGPYSGRLVADLMRGQPSDLDLTPYAPARFTGGAPAVPEG
jgi:D-amino-acid dehydrogenase